MTPDPLPYIIVGIFVVAQILFALMLNYFDRKLTPIEKQIEELGRGMKALAAKMDQFISNTDYDFRALKTRERNQEKEFQLKRVKTRRLNEKEFEELANKVKKGNEEVDKARRSHAAD